MLCSGKAICILNQLYLSKSWSLRFHWEHSAGLIYSNSDLKGYPPCPVSPKTESLHSNSSGGCPTPVLPWLHWIPCVLCPDVCPEDRFRSVVMVEVFTGICSSYLQYFCRPQADFLFLHS